MSISDFEDKSQPSEARPWIELATLRPASIAAQRILLIGQLRLLLLRAERGLQINSSSVLRLALLARNIDECSSPAVEKPA